MTWLETTDAGSPLEAVLGTDPDLLAHFRDVVARFWSEKLVDPVVLEICRLRIAKLLGCDAELQLRYQPAIEAGLGELKISLIPEYTASPAFSAHERACLALTEQFVFDAHGIDDDTFREVSSGFSTEQLASFLAALSYFEKVSRMKLMLELGAPDGTTIVPCPHPDTGVIY